MSVVDGGVETLPLHLLNPSNKDLTHRIAELEARLDAATREGGEHRERLRFMQDHLGNVKAEILNTHALFDAQRRDVQTEDHLCQLAERERGRVRQRLENFERERGELQEQLDAVQNRIFQGNLRMDEFKSVMHLNQEELEQWDLARKQKEDDGAVMGKYAKSDEAKIRELNFTVEKLSKSLQQKREELDRERTLAQAAQIELDKAAVDYRKLHDERQQLISQWEEAVRAMHRRDDAIKSAGDRYSEGKQWQEKRERQLKQRAEFYQLEINNNRELESKIAQEERVLIKYREDLVTLDKHVRDAEDEVEVLRNTLNKATHDKGQLQAGKSNLEQQLRDRRAQYERMQSQHEEIIKKLEDEIAAASDLERQNKLVAELFAQTEQSSKSLDKEMTRIKDEQYEHSQALHTVRMQQATFLAEVSGAQAQGRNMNAKIAQLDAATFKQQELLYNIEFNVQQMERKVNRAKGERTEEEKRELQEKIGALQKMFDDIQTQHKVLASQVKRVNEELRHARHDVTTLEAEKRRVNDILLELTLENESCTAETNRTRTKKDEALVSADVLKLQVERLKTLLHSRDKELLGLENRRQQMAITVAEREAEIHVHHDVLKMEAKTSEEERRRVSAELAERMRQVQHLKNRYEVLLGRMDKEQGQLSHAQHIVRLAKEREELQVKGDGLDSAIKALERELRKLDKTIAVLQGSNVKYKDQFKKVMEGDEDVLQQKFLRQKAKELQTIITRRAGEAKDFMKTELAKSSELQERQREKTEAEEAVTTVATDREGMERDIESERELTARYEVAVAKARRTTEPEIAEDIALLEEQERYNSVVLHLLGAAQEHGEDVHNAVESMLRRHDIEVPSLFGAEGPVEPGDDD